MQMEIMNTAATATGVSTPTKASGLLALIFGLPTTIAAGETGEWSAVAFGAAVTGISGTYALIGFFRDQVVKAKNKQIDDLAAALEAERAKRKAAEDISDTWERKAHRLQGELTDSQVELARPDLAEIQKPTPPS